MQQETASTTMESHPRHTSGRETSVYNPVRDRPYAFHDTTWVTSSKEAFQAPQPLEQTHVLAKPPSVETVTFMERAPSDTRSGRLNMGSKSTTHRQLYARRALRTLEQLEEEASRAPVVEQLRHTAEVMYERSQRPLKSVDPAHNTSLFLCTETTRSIRSYQKDEINHHDRAVTFSTLYVFGKKMETLNSDESKAGMIDDPCDRGMEPEVRLQRLREQNVRPPRKSAPVGGYRTSTGTTISVEQKLAFEEPRIPKEMGKALKKMEKDMVRKGNFDPPSMWRTTTGDAAAVRAQ